jgi:hypothetical protein
MVVEPASPRPLAVTVALVLIAAALVVGAAASLADLFASRTSEGEGLSSPWSTLAVSLIMYAISAGLLAALFYRRRWAWWVWLALFVLGLPGLWTGLRYGLDEGAFTAARYLLSSVTDVAAAVLLLLRPSRQWFGVARRSGKPSPWRWSDSPREP